MKQRLVYIIHNIRLNIICVYVLMYHCTPTLAAASRPRRLQRCASPSLVPSIHVVVVAVDLHSPAPPRLGSQGAELEEKKMSLCQPGEQW